jgi:hypothetical protein
MEWFFRFLHKKILAHFWGIIEKAFISALVGICFHLLDNAGLFDGLADALKVSYQIFNIAGDILWVAGLIVGIPSGITYIIGRALGKYYFRKRPERNY